MSQRKVIFVVGSTASGKSDWALRLAQKYSGVILNCDSVQVYKYLDIGSAKPSLEERSLLPHYLFDYVLPPEESTAGTYCRDFYNCLESIPAETPIFVVGGTGFYFMAIEKGMYPVVPIDPAVKNLIEQELNEEGGAERLYEELKSEDPEYAFKIHVADKYRIGRGLEIIRSQGQTVSQLQLKFEAERKPFPHQLLKIGPIWDRDVLRTRIEKRVQGMLKQGLLQEVQQALDNGLRDWAPMNSVGYKEAVSYIDGHIDLKQLQTDLVTNTYQLAKRQRTWFQRDKTIHWFEGSSGFETMQAQVEEFLRS